MTKPSSGRILYISLLSILLGSMWFLGGCAFFQDDLPERAVRADITSTPAATTLQGGNDASGNDSEPQPAATSIPEAAAEVEPDTTTGGKADLAQLTTEEQLKAVVAPTSDLNELALRLRPDVDAIPPTPSAPADYPIGHLLDFWVQNVQTNEASQITAKLAHKTDVAYAWVEVDQNFDQVKLIKSINTFSKELYPKAVDFFGQENNPGVDNDPRLHIVHTSKTGGGVAGYFSSADTYSSVANQYSNEKEMFYISLTWLNGLSNYERYESVLSHEFQHMIHFAKDSNEESWINEGLSEFSKEVVGFGPVTGFIGAYSNAPDTQLNTWNESGTNNSAHYGSSYLFITYFAQRFGSELTKAIIAEPANGTEGVTRVLQAAGLDETFNTIFGDWLIANYVDDPFALGQNRVFGYEILEHKAPFLAATHTTFPTGSQDANTNNFAVDYILLQPKDEQEETNVTFTFNGTAQTRLADTKPASGQAAWWSNRSDEMDVRLTRQFDLTNVAQGTSIEMTANMWWDIEEGYDYGYALASRDGLKWQILDGRYTTLENPSGASFGAAYNAKSDGDVNSPAKWVNESYDLSDYAGEQIWVRFEYVTDGAVNMPGWFIDDIEIPAINYSTDFESGTDGWQSEGWLLTDNVLPQGWLVQLFTLQDNILEEVYPIPVDANGNANFDIPTLGKNRTAVITISGTAPVTTEAADYQYSIE